VARLVFRDRALEREQPGLLHVPLLQQALIGREFLLLQLERPFLRRDLLRECARLLHRLLDLALENLDLSVERFASRTEQRLFALDEFPLLQILGEIRPRRERALGLEAGHLGALGLELGA